LLFLHSRLSARRKNDLDAGREFLDGCLKGNFDKAAFYMLPGAENTKALHTIENNYHKK